MPTCYDLLVNLTESRATIDALLLSMEQGAYGGTGNADCALGRAMQAAAKLIASIGGKILVLLSALPSVGEGALKRRLDKRLLGTPKESQLLQVGNAFYRNFAITCSPFNISLDFFLFNREYADTATLSACAKYTGGTLYYYPGFDAGVREHAVKLAAELEHVLTKPLAMEAVLRTRVSRGLRMTAFHGNFFLRSSDLLALACVNPDSCATVEMVVEEDLQNDYAYFQAALLHTSAQGASPFPWWLLLSFAYACLCCCRGDAFKSAGRGYVSGQATGASASSPRPCRSPATRPTSSTPSTRCAWPRC